MAASRFTLHIPVDVAGQLRKCRASIRQTIRTRLREIVEGLTSRPATRKPGHAAQGPPLRFYVFEGYRISYKVNPLTRKVVVLKMRTEPG